GLDFKGAEVGRGGAVQTALVHGGNGDPGQGRGRRPLGQGIAARAEGHGRGQAAVGEGQRPELGLAGEQAVAAGGRGAVSQQDRGAEQRGVGGRGIDRGGVVRVGEAGAGGGGVVHQVVDARGGHRVGQDAVDQGERGRGPLG